jgi:hypothetical protein
MQRSNYSDVYQMMNASGFLHPMIYSPETSTILALTLLLATLTAGAGPGR